MEINDIIAVLVIYNQDINESISYNSLKESLLYSKKVVDLFIYDNSPISKLNYFEIKNDECFNITIHKDSDNSGVSKAYNCGAKYGLLNKKKWILLLDQDTYFPIDTIQLYLNSDINYPKISIFCPILLTEKEQIVSPSLFKYGRGYMPKALNFGENNLMKFCPVNSGLLILLEKFHYIRGYNEKIKLDYSDYSFFKKMKKYEKKFVLLPIKCKHQLSTFEDSTFENALIRFKYLCIGCRESTENLIDYFQHFSNILKRALVLSIKYKNFRFFKYFFKYFFKNGS